MGVNSRVKDFLVIPKVFPSMSCSAHTKAIAYDMACFIYLIPGLISYFPKAQNIEGLGFIERVFLLCTDNFRLVLESNTGQPLQCWYFVFKDVLKSI